MKKQKNKWETLKILNVTTLKKTRKSTLSKQLKKSKQTGKHSETTVDTKMKKTFEHIPQTKFKKNN